jgi:hypothetical protein
MISLPDTSGTNIDVQIFCTAKISGLNHRFQQNGEKKKNQCLLLWIMLLVSKLIDNR